MNLRSRTNHGVAVAAVMAATAMALANAAPAQAAVSGTVTCGNAKSVQGVYVNAGRQSGWAWIGKIDGAAYQVNWYRGEVPRGSSYSINVGCGSWTTTYYSDKNDRHSGDFVCVKKINHSSSLSNRCWDS